MGYEQKSAKTFDSYLQNSRFQIYPGEDEVLS